MIKPRQWEEVSSTAGRVWRHVGCGDLVRDGWQRAHMLKHLGRSLDEMERVLDEYDRQRSGDKVIEFPALVSE